MKIAIFGGSFDPVHYGHESIVKNAINTLKIDRLIIVPTFLSPFKQSVYADNKMRLKWLKKVFDYDEKIVIDEYEINQNCPTPSIKTVLYLYEKYKIEKNEKAYFLIGADHLKTLHKWHEYEKLKTLVDFVIASRDGIFIPNNFDKMDINVDISSSEIRNELRFSKINDKIKDEVMKFYKELK